MEAVEQGRGGDLRGVLCSGTWANRRREVGIAGHPSGCVRHVHSPVAVPQPQMIWLGVAGRR